MVTVCWLSGIFIERNLPNSVLPASGSPQITTFNLPITELISILSVSFEQYPAFINPSYVNLDFFVVFLTKTHVPVFATDSCKHVILRHSSSDSASSL